MDQNEDKKWRMPWYDWLVFLLPSLFIISLGLESALGSPLRPDGTQYQRFPRYRTLV